MIDKVFPKIHNEGYKFLVIFGLGTLVLYLISGFRYSFYEVSDVSLFTSTLTILTILIGCIMFITYTFSKGYRIKD